MKWEEGDYEGSGEKGNYRWQMQPLGCQEVTHMEVRIWKVIPLSCPFLLPPPTECLSVPPDIYAPSLKTTV